MATALGPVMAALVTTFDAATTATVYDGPVPTSDGPTEYVLVGSTGEDDDDDATLDAVVSAMGPGNWHDETGEIRCSAWAWSGDTDIATVRNQAVALFEVCREAVEDDRTLGSTLPLNGLAEVGGAALRQQQTTAGAICRVVFTVRYRTTHVD